MILYMAGDKIRILIADDSGFMRLLIRDILVANKNMTVVSTVANGKEAVEKTVELRPDVVLLDMIMPDYDGLYAVREIMKKCPTPIVVLSSIGNSNIEPIMKALELGAFDYLNKPVKGNSQLRTIDAELFQKVKAAANSKVPISRKAIKGNKNDHVFAKKLLYKVVVIGSSTGGPNALEELLRRLPGNMAVPVIIAQHMPENFIPSFAKRLDKLIPLNVVVGIKGMVLQKGTVIIAPGNKNIVIRRDPVSKKVMIDYTFKKYTEFNNPSVDALMDSVAEVYGKRSIGVILTGMGKDGTVGMMKIKEVGGYTIAQNKESCAVFGMPREAIERNCIDSVVSIKGMGGFITSALS